MAFMALLLAGSIAWWRHSTRDRRAMCAVGLSLIALGILPIANWMVVTDRESVDLALKSMEKHANAKNFKFILDGIDPEFRSHGGLDRKGLHALLSTLETRYGVRTIQVRRPEILAPNPDGTFPCEFTMRLTGDFGELVVLVKTTWKKQDGVWRILKVVVTRMLDKDQTPLPV